MGRHLKISPVLITPSPAPITPFSAIVLPNKLAANGPSNIERSYPCCSSVSFLIVLLIPCASDSDSSTNLTIFVISSISSFEIINAVVLDP